jgi:hypothetical protein
VWKDVRAAAEEPCGIRTDAALPRTAKQVIDEDLPGMGQFYCKLSASPAASCDRTCAAGMEKAAR